MTSPATTRYKPAHANIAHESMDGEVVVIDVQRGTYYSLCGTAAAIWDAMVTGASASEIASGFAREGAENCAEIIDACVSFLESLVAEGLLVAADDLACGADFSPGSAPFEQPVFLKYTDMQEMLLADPVHEVTEKGWPYLES